MPIMLLSLKNAVLEELEFNGPQTPEELSDKLHQPRAYIFSTLAALGAEGFVSYEPGKRERRYMLVSHG